MYKYKILCKKGEGTFSEVLKAQTKNNKLVAIKRMKARFDSLEQVNNLREVQALRRLSPHPNIIKLIEVVFEKSTGMMALVFELMDMNLYELVRSRRTYLPEKTIKLYVWQMLKALEHMHRNGIFHRDIKPENLLIKDERLKLCDFGSCRGIRSRQPYTEYISTRWYRAPECLLTDGYYGYKMDIWGVGCVWFEVLSLFPLFPGTNELDQIQKIHNVIGTPPREVLHRYQQKGTHMNFNFPHKEGTGLARLVPSASPEGLDLISKLLEYCPENRLKARTAMIHPYFRELREAERLTRQGTQLIREIEPPRQSGKSREDYAAESLKRQSSKIVLEPKQIRYPPIQMLHAEGRDAEVVSLKEKSVEPRMPLLPQVSSMQHPPHPGNPLRLPPAIRAVGGGNPGIGVSGAAGASSSTIGVPPPPQPKWNPASVYMDKQPRKSLPRLLDSILPPAKPMHSKFDSMASNTSNISSGVYGSLQPSKPTMLPALSMPTGSSVATMLHRGWPNPNEKKEKEKALALERPIWRH